MPVPGVAAPLEQTTGSPDGTQLREVSYTNSHRIEAHSACSVQLSVTCFGPGIWHLP